MYTAFKILLSHHLVIKLWPLKIIRKGKEDPSTHIVTRAVIFSWSPSPCFCWVFVSHCSTILSYPWFAGGNPLSSIAYIFFGSILVFITNFSTRSNHSLIVSGLRDTPCCCHNLAKWPSYYLYFFSLLIWTYYKEEV